jgi:Lar family restriction alleviation protein
MNNPTQNLTQKQHGNPELKPCPFCGSTSLKIESKHHGTHYYSGTHSATVRCCKCHARGGTASCKVEKGKYHADDETNQRAIEAWNRRAADVVPREMIAEIFAEINAIKQEYANGDIHGDEMYVRLYMLEKKYTEDK